MSTLHVEPRSGNPTLNERAFDRPLLAGQERMTLGGTANKTFLLLALVVLGAGWTWHQATLGAPALYPLMLVGVIGGLVFALVTSFKPEWARVTAPLYALLEGLALGGVSAVSELAYPGVVLPAVGLTFGTLAAMLVVYRSGLIKVTDRFRLMVVSATGGVALFYLVQLGLSFFGISLPGVAGSGLIGLGVSLLVVGLAALNLVLDFDFIEQGARQGAPAYMEWYGAFGLMVTLVWLYLEILRLLSKLQSRR